QYARGIAHAIGESRRLEGDIGSSMGRSQVAATAAGTVISGGFRMALEAVRITNAAVSDFIVNSVKLAAEAEQNAISFEVMLGSADKARKLMAEIQEFAASTPFELPELTGATRKLLAFGFAEDEVIGKPAASGTPVAPPMMLPMDLAGDVKPPAGGMTSVDGRLRDTAKPPAESLVPSPAFIDLLQRGPAKEGRNDLIYRGSQSFAATIPAMTENLFSQVPRSVDAPPTAPPPVNVPLTLPFTADDVAESIGNQVFPKVRQMINDAKQGARAAEYADGWGDSL
ncbi:MAG TPA: hypothetical protein VGB55_02290, partial [Tepidisphaeraceae bacterium]